VPEQSGQFCADFIDRHGAAAPNVFGTARFPIVGGHTTAQGSGLYLNGRNAIPPQAASPPYQKSSPPPPFVQIRCTIGHILNKQRDEVTPA
jgi:hypothetical protein